MTHSKQPSEITVRKKGQIRHIPFVKDSNSTHSDAEQIGPYTPSIMTLDAYDNGGQKLMTSHEDRTKAYTRRMRPLTILGGAAVAFALVTQGRIPLWSLAFVAVVLGASLSFLLVGEMIYQLVSPDGTNLFVAFLHHRRLTNEQEYIFSNLTGNERKNNQNKTILYALIITGVLCLIVLTVLSILEWIWR